MSIEQPLVARDLLVRVTTRRLARSLEAAALLFQTANIAASTFVENPSLIGKQVMYGLAIVHTLALFAVLRFPGPLTGGGPRTVLWVGMALLMPLIVANVYAPGDYARFRGGIQLGGYSMAVLAALAFYPWKLNPRLLRFRLYIELAILSLVMIEPLLIVLRLHHGYPSTENLISVGMSAGWSVVTYTAGKTLPRLFRSAAKLQFDTLQQSYAEFFGFLHSHVDGVLAVLRGSTDGQHVERQIERLKEIIDERRVDMLLVRDPMPLPEILKETVKLYSPSLTFADVPEIGTFSVQRPIGIIVHRALGDLLKNAAQHGADTVWIRFSYTATTINFAIIDNGPGFDKCVFKDPVTSLRRLQADIEQLGGHLIYHDTNDKGAHLTFSLPLYPAHLERW
jgi:hypothetical protein